MAESFFSTIKTELIYRHSWNTRHEAELAIFAWVEGWYNPERIMQALDMRSPDEYEAAFYAAAQNPHRRRTGDSGIPVIRPPGNRGNLSPPGSTAGVSPSQLPVTQRHTVAFETVLPRSLRQQDRDLLAGPG